MKTWAFTAVLLVSAFSVSAQPPSTRLNPGLWHYSSTSQYLGHTIHREWKHCLTSTQGAVRGLNRPAPGSKLSCNPPTLAQDTNGGYHTTMDCTMSGGMVNAQIHEDFHLRASAGGDHFQANGIVEENLTIPGAGQRHIQVNTIVKAQRTGACSQ